MGETKRYKVLIVEDDPAYAEPLKHHLNQTDEFVTIGVTNSEEEALKLVKAGLPDAMIVDLQLKDGEGDGLLLLQQIRAWKDVLPISPYIFVLTNVTAERTWERLDSGLADFTFSKRSLNYSPEKIIKHLYAMIPVFDRNLEKKPQLEDAALDKEAFLRRRIDRELDLYFIVPSNDIKEVLAESIYLVIDLPAGKRPIMRDILTQAGKKYGKKYQNVHARIENLIQKAFTETDKADLEKAYTPYQSVSRGTPTPKDFILYIANKIRAEDLA